MSILEPDQVSEPPEPEPGEPGTMPEEEEGVTAPEPDTLPEEPMSLCRNLNPRT